MAARGVVCQDCHEPHAAALRAAGNGLCLRCHGSALDSVSHSHHPVASPGSECVACHMREALFMERDRRRDHGLARPDPEGAAAAGAPDACTSCHASETQAWAAAWVARWYGPSGTLLARRAVAAAIDGGKRGDDTAVPALVRVLGSSEVDGVRRASAARLLASWVDRPAVVTALVAAAADPESLVRAGAVRSLGEASLADARIRLTLLQAAGDPVRLVRAEAGFALRAIELPSLGPEARAAVAEAFGAWLSAQALLADWPEPQYNRGIFLEARGEIAAAEAAYRTAIHLRPADLPPRQNLAMLLARAGREAAAEAEWQALLAREPGWPPAACALAVLYRRQARLAEAAAQLTACVDHTRDVER